MENSYSIELLARDRQRQFLDEAAHARLVRQATGQADRPVRNRPQFRSVVGLGPLYARVRTRFGSKPRPKLTREPAG